MGYLATLKQSKFFIKAENKEKAFQHLKSALRPKTVIGISQDGQMTTSTADSKTLEEFLDIWSYGASVDEEGNIDDIEFNSDKPGDSEELFEALAPFVKHGSFIEWEGEDGWIWRWKFVEGKLQEETATLVWKDAEGRKEPEPGANRGTAVPEDGKDKVVRMMRTTETSGSMVGSETYVMVKESDLKILLAIVEVATKRSIADMSKGTLVEIKQYLDKLASDMERANQYGA